jgi:UDP:flavonoid glycosyltransferase YjiC (YdhE family)
VADLAGCRAVFATAGNQLISEAMHLRKPMLLLPEDSLEQRLNAIAVREMGIGMRTSRKKVSAGQLRTFLSGEAGYRESFPDRPTDGRAQAVRAIEQFARELTGLGSE